MNLGDDSDLEIVLSLHWSFLHLTSTFCGLFGAASNIHDPSYHENDAKHGEKQDCYHASGQTGSLI